YGLLRSRMSARVTSVSASSGARSRSVDARKSASTSSGPSTEKNERNTRLPHFSHARSRGGSSRSKRYSRPHSMQIWTRTPSAARPTRPGASRPASSRSSLARSASRLRCSPRSSFGSRSPWPISPSSREGRDRPGLRSAPRRTGSAAGQDRQRHLPQAHPLAYLPHRLLRQTPTPRRAVSQDLTHPLGMRPVLRRPLPHGLERPRDPFRENALALHAPDLRRTTLRANGFALLRRREEPAQRIAVAQLGPPGVAPPHPLRIRRRRPRPRVDRGRIVEHPHGVPAGLAHLRLAVEPADPARIPDQRLRLREV